jgi:serine/threonine-protein kinase
MQEPTVGGKLDDFEITELLARTAMSSVFKGIDTRTGAAVVLKVPHIQYESDVVFFERFKREEEIGARLDHPNIVKMVVPSEKSRMYLAFEFVQGRSLHALMQEQRPFPRERASKIALQVCDALAYLHRSGVIHRDIKPENILIDDAGDVRIIDFGIATAEAARRLTWAGLSHAVGTPEYMSPEQIRGRRGDARTDVYALGTLLYEMLSGRLPYESANAMALLRDKLKEPAAPLAKQVPGLDPALEAIVLKCLELAPRDRYGSAVELMRDLTNPAGVNPSTGGAARRAVDRRRSTIALTAVLGALLTGAGLLALMTMSRHG